MTVGDLRKELEGYDDKDIVTSETRGDNYTNPSVYDNAYIDDRDNESYYDSIEEALENGVPRENIKRQVMVTGHS
tara:strand:- start:275 stop:499 length:225 start_codon:yes stop_codon:yes gene_type:complete